MKVLVVVLTLAVFTGCNAAVLSGSIDIDHRTLNDAFWDYVTKATHTADDILLKINAMISESTDVVNQYTVALRDPNTRLLDLLAKITHEAKLLKKAVTPDLEALDSEAPKATPVQKSELKEIFGKALAEALGEALSPRFQVQLAQRTQELQVQLAQRTQELQQNLAPFGEELKKLELNAQDLKARLTALWESFTQKSQ